ncbi:MAG: DUF3667 domain-containing protein, partial [Acidobacteria bacterium]|nr:DUF3667 domain-containing protein [Acidobacteriota bacterium]
MRNIALRCANCGIELVGDYCHGCGQHVAEANELALRPLARRFGDELLHLDFKSVRTLLALFNPGRLTREFLNGRRRPYLSPLKLYFLAAAIFF